ncbi:hypothetical protein GJU40_04070 [Bacillus lacus]|uniref:YrhC family protein n=1 Tax=Metabacillus lacus TaxID=1983721 RepID=A0A7X2IXC6_9BACI|nr:YrhC family protein [Metabacillus lacus]MRX71349.1 hypothetical protein [Metabacillus lacus]
MSKKEISSKMTDYKYYAFTLLAVSVYLYLGLILPTAGDLAQLQVTLMMTTVCVFLSGSFLFFKKSLKYKKMIDDEAVE